MALPTPPPYTTPIPNNPFYSAPSYLVQGAYSPYVVGAGLFVSPTGTISSTGGGGGAVASIIAGAGIGVSSPTGNVTLTNTGVTSLIAGAGITLSGNTGNITISASGTGTVTSVGTGTGLTGGPITTSGVISLANTGVTAATYTNPTIVVDAQGRITSASSGSAVGSVVGTAPISVTTALGTATVGITAATTTACGAVQLSDSTSSSSSTTAATSLAVKTAFDAAIAAIPKACISAKGALVTGTGPSVPVALPPGANGLVLTTDSTCAEGLKWAAASAVSPATPTVFGTVKGITTDSTNTAYGCFAGCSLTPGCRTTVVGVRAGCDLTTGDGNTALGNDAMRYVATGDYNVAIGERAMHRAGVSAGRNVALGVVALEDVTGLCNTGIGFEAGLQMLGGNSNVFLGQAAARDNTSGDRNVVIGPNTTTSSLTVSCELVIGYNAGQNWLTGNSTKAIQPGAGIIDCASSCGTANQVLTSQGNAIEWKSVNSALAAPNYGSFYDTTTQVNTVGTGTGRAITLNTTDISNNFSIVSGSQITAAAAGTYNLQFSVQFETSQASAQTIEIWLVKNGIAVANTNTEFVSKGSGEAYFAALNYLVQMTAGDYVELYWASGDSNMVLLTQASSYGGPQIPSVILTIVPVGA